MGTAVCIIFEPAFDWAQADNMLSKNECLVMLSLSKQIRSKKLNLEPAFDRLRLT